MALQPRSLRDRFFRGASWVLGGRILSALATLVVNAMLARLLSPSEMGVYFLVVSLVTIAAIFSGWGLSRGIVKLIAANLAKDRLDLAYTHIVSSLKLVSAIAVGIALLILTPFGRWALGTFFDAEGLQNIVWLIAAWVLFQSLQGIISESFRGFHEIALATIFGGLASSVVSAGLFTTAMITKGTVSLEYALSLTLGAVFLSLLTGSALLKRRCDRLEKTANSTIPEIARFGFPLLVTSISFLGVKELHIWILAAYRPQEDVAVFGAVLRLINLLAMPLVIANAVLPPMVAELFAAKRTTEMQNLLQKTATLIALPGLFLFLIIVIWGSDLLTVVYGQHYAVGATAFSIIAIGQLINVLTGSPGIVLTMSGSEKQFMHSAIAAGIIGISISAVATPFFGVLGVAIGYCSGIALINLLAWGLVLKKLGIKTHGSIPVLLTMLADVRAMRR